MRNENLLINATRFFCTLAAGGILLLACGQNSQKYEEEMMARTEFGMAGPDLEYREITQSENGYYIWERVNPQQLYPHLLFMDKESGRVVPLCNKPDCTHEGRECNAYFPLFDFGKDGVDRHYIQYYDGKLYASGLSADDYVSLFEIKPDGSEWEISTKLFRTDYSSSGRWRSPEILIENGYVYFVDSRQNKMKLERMAIAGGTPEIVFEGDSEALYVDVFRMKNADDVIFFQVSFNMDGSLENAIEGLYCYDMLRGQCSLIKEGCCGPYSVRDGFVYYANTEGLCCYSIHDQTTNILNDQPMDVPNITLTNNFIILCDQMKDHSLILYDYEGKKAATVPNTLGLQWYFGGDSDMLFGQYAGAEGLGLCYLDLTRPLDELQWEELKAE